MYPLMTPDAWMGGRLSDLVTVDWDFAGPVVLVGAVHTARESVLNIPVVLRGAVLCRETPRTVREHAVRLPVASGSLVAST